MPDDLFEKRKIPEDDNGLGFFRARPRPAFEFPPYDPKNWVMRDPAEEPPITEELRAFLDDFGIGLRTRPGIIPAWRAASERLSPGVLRVAAEGMLKIWSTSSDQFEALLLAYYADVFPHAVIAKLYDLNVVRGSIDEISGRLDFSPPENMSEVLAAIRFVPPYRQLPPGFSLDVE